MAKSIEQRAGKYVKKVDAACVPMLKHVNVIMEAIDDVATLRYRGRNLLPCERDTFANSVERGGSNVRFVGALLVHGLPAAIAVGRVVTATMRFERHLEKAMPEAVVRISNGEVEYYDIASQILGIDGEAAFEARLAAAGLSDQQEAS